VDVLRRRTALRSLLGDVRFFGEHQARRTTRTQKHLFDPLPVHRNIAGAVVDEMDGHPVVNPHRVAAAAALDGLIPNEEEVLLSAQLGADDDLQVPESPILQVELFVVIGEDSHGHLSSRAVTDGSVYVLWPSGASLSSRKWRGPTCSLRSKHEDHTSDNLSQLGVDGRDFFLPGLRVGPGLDILSSPGMPVVSAQIDVDDTPPVDEVSHNTLSYEDLA